MRKLNIPKKLVQEFATVEAVWCSQGPTRRVDAVMLSWIKYEKQLRRLFCFVVYQHPNITHATLKDVMSVMANNRNLNPTTFVDCIAALNVTPVKTLVGSKHALLAKELVRIKKYRNKLMHGQISGQNIRSAQLERDTLLIVEWMSSLADGGDKVFGYDGLRRNTFVHAKKASVVAQNFPFHDAATFKAWLEYQTQN